MYQSFKDFKHRILVSTDIWGRGIDIERVNIVVNYDVPDSPDSYLHRVGRAGRFGTKGLAITFASSDEDAKVLESVQQRFEADALSLRYDGLRNAWENRVQAARRLAQARACEAAAGNVDPTQGIARPRLS